VTGSIAEKRMYVINYILGAAALAKVFQWFSRGLLDGSVEMLHDDIIPNYWPFREWFTGRLLTGHWPLWNPYWGLGRVAEAWTTLPIDILTPVQILFGLDISQLNMIQVGLLFAITFAVLCRLTRNGYGSAIATAIFVFSPNTNYFIFYYFHLWSYFGLVLGLYFTNRFFARRGLSALVGLYCALVITAVGAKPDLTAETYIALAAAAFAAAVWDRRGGAWRVFAAHAGCTAAAAMTNAWYLAIVLTSGGSSIRFARLGDFTLGEFLHSLGASVTIPENSGVCVALALVAAWLIRRWGARPTGLLVAAVAVAVVLAAGVGEGFVPNAIMRWDIAGVALAAVSLWLGGWQNRSATDWARLIVLWQPLLVYWGIAAPGALDEATIASWARPSFDVVIATLACLGVARRNSRLATTAYACLAAELIMRTLGQPWYNYLTGLMWLPSRSNFIDDFALAALGAVGITELGSLTRQWHAAFGWWFRVPIAAALTTATLLLILPNLNTPYRFAPGVAHFTPAPFETYAQAQVEAWKSAMQFPDPRTARVLSYDHGYGLNVGIDDAREYQSLTSARYVRYSIYHRLGVALWHNQNIGGLTGGVSAAFSRMLRPIGLPADVKGEHDITYHAINYDFYFDYIVRAMPPLDCGILRLFGISYIDGPDGYSVHANRYFMANAYSTVVNSYYREPGTTFKMGDDVVARIDGCHFPVVRIQGQRYWHIPDAMPRAFFVPRIAGLDPDTLANAVDATDAGDGTLQITPDLRVPWSGVTISRYYPEQVTLDVDAKQPGYVILTDIFSRGWRASVDGKDAPILPGLYLFRAVEVPAGTHQIDMVFRPRAVSVGVWLSALGILLAAGVFITYVRQTRYKPQKLA